MERGGEEGEKVARLGKKVRIGVLTSDRENVQGEQKARSEERASQRGKGLWR